MPRPLAGGDPSQSETAKARAKALIGRTISDRYRIVELVAMGAMGAVYKGEHLLMRKQVALKVLHPETEDFPELVARFEREAIAGAHISHPNVASASDFGRFDDDSYFLVLEFIEGMTLSKLLREGPVEPLRTAKIIRQAALALGAAHEKGIVHRDVKPNNVMLCDPSGSKTGASNEEELVKLIDFGLAKVPVEKLTDVARDPTTDGKELTHAGVVMGTVAYMAPETAYGMSAVDARADLYALGVIAYEMLSGKHLFDETEPQKLFAAHSSRKPAPLAERAPDVNVPDDLERIVMRLLEKDPSNRFPDAESLVGALDAFKMRVAVHGTVSLKRPEIATTTETPGASPASGSGGHYLPKRTILARRPPPWWAIGAAVAVVLAVVVYALTRPSKPTAPGSRDTSADVSKPKETAASLAIPPSLAPMQATGTSAGADAVRAAATADPANAATLLSGALSKDSSILKDRALWPVAARAAGNLAEGGAPEATAIFDQLATKAGESGLDVLYAIASSSDMPKASQKARAELERADIISSGSVPLKIAYELLRSDCKKREFLFGRAATEGDDRALAILSSMMPPQCDPKASACCFSKHGELERAISEIGARAGR